MSPAADAVCDRLERLDPAVLAFLPERGRRDRLRAEAAAVAARHPDPARRPPLYGVPVGVKDIIRVDGLPTRAGSALPPRVLAGPESSAVGRLRAAGALVAGKTVTAEFAVAAPGPTRNPRAPGRTPGGSSSGSAAAVAAGTVPLALGTQTVGSVIRPAAYCGVAGFRPTHGRIPTDGVLPNVPLFDVVGVFTPDVPGAATAAAVLCDAWHPAADLPAPVLGVPAGPYLERADPGALTAFASRAALLRDAGFEVREVPFLPEFDGVARELRALNRYSLARSHAAWFPLYGHLYRRGTATAVREGMAVTEQAYRAGLRARRDLIDRIAQLAAAHGLDGWITPGATGAPPAGLRRTGDPVMCLPWSAAGLPAVAVPAGSDDDGLPVAVQCVGAPGADETLLSWAARAERALRTGLAAR